MSVLDLFGKKEVGDDLTKGVPFSLKLRLSPYRLVAKKNDKIDLIVNVKNRTKEPLMTSLVVKVPKNLGFDSIGLNKAREIRVGYIAPEEEKEIHVDICSSLKTEATEYTIAATAFSHYRDYAHVLNSMTKTISVRAV